MMPANELAAVIVKALDAKKGENIQLLKTQDLTTLADYFVIATGSSNTQINALVDSVEKVLLDYGCIAVHVFSGEAREFYGLERLWRDGKPLDLTGVVD